MARPLRGVQLCLYEKLLKKAEKRGGHTTAIGTMQRRWRGCTMRRQGACDKLRPCGVYFYLLSPRCFNCAEKLRLSRNSKVTSCLQVRTELVPRPGFEPGSWARKAHILDRARLPAGVAGAGYGPRTARAVSLCLWNKNFIPSCTGVLVGLS